MSLDRKELMNICEDAIVPCADWYDRDSYSTQVQVPEIINLINGEKGVINLNMHGFLLYSDTLEIMEATIDNLKFDVKEL